MASVLTDFTKKREFLVCMDSDGCVMDTVSIKHTIVMCPELIRVFALDDHADFVASAWEEINLRNITRGLSRFESVVLVFDRLKNRGIEVPGQHLGLTFPRQLTARTAAHRHPSPAQTAGVEQCLQPPHPGLGADL